MTVIEPVLHLKHIMAIFGVSQATIYRWLAEARAGKSSFPLALNGYKRKLLWNKADVEAFCQARTVPQVPVQVSTKQRDKKDYRARQASVEQALARHGINLNNKK